MATVIDSFKDEYRFLSNFWPCEVEFEGEMYYSVEHAYQAAKTPSPEERKQIREAETAGIAKRMGAKVKSLPLDWDARSLVVMDNLLRQKFKQGTELANQLIKTGDKPLVEGNRWHDEKWGVCRCGKCLGIGTNYLGKLLMKIREELKTC